MMQSEKSVIVRGHQGVRAIKAQKKVTKHAQQLREGNTDHGAMSHHATHDGNQWTRQDAVLPCARMLAP